MTLLAPRTIGWIILALFSVQGAFTLLSPGSLRLQKPEGGFWSWLYNGLNLGTILVLTPLAMLALLKGWGTVLETIAIPGLEPAADALLVLGLASYTLGNVLFYWSRLTLGRSFRIGAVPPGAEDRLIERGPYRWVRHPMYTTVLLTTLGLALTLRSWLFLAAAVVVAIAFGHLIPEEEAQLERAYGQAYRDYAGRTRRLIPRVY
jgi:protein-S-isoprenylcysteine O-methyltransferase Ste14